MKKNLIVLIAALALFAALRPLAASAYPPFVVADNYFVPPGGAVRFSGAQFAPDETVVIRHGRQTIGQMMSGSDGRFTTMPIRVPYGHGADTYTFIGARSGFRAHSMVMVGPRHFPWLELSSYYAPAGTSIALTARGFGVSEAVNFYLDREFIGQAIASPDGEASLIAAAPSGDATRRFGVVGALTGNWAVAGFTPQSS